MLLIIDEDTTSWIQDPGRPVDGGPGGAGTWNMSNKGQYFKSLPMSTNSPMSRHQSGLALAWQTNRRTDRQTSMAGGGRGFGGIGRGRRVRHREFGREGERESQSQGESQLYDGPTSVFILTRLRDGVAVCDVPS